MPKICNAIKQEFKNKEPWKGQDLFFFHKILRYFCEIAQNFECNRVVLLGQFGTKKDGMHTPAGEVNSESSEAGNY